MLSLQYVQAWYMNKVDQFFSCYLTYGISFASMWSTQEKEVQIRKEKENRNVYVDNENDNRKQTKQQVWYIIQLMYFFA